MEPTSNEVRHYAQGQPDKMRVTHLWCRSSSQPKPLVELLGKSKAFEASSLTAAVAFAEAEGLTYAGKVTEEPEWSSNRGV